MIMVLVMVFVFIRGSVMGWIMWWSGVSHGVGVLFCKSMLNCVNVYVLICPKNI